jgi:hypothetical protein
VEIGRFFESSKGQPSKTASPEPSRSLEHAPNLHTSNSEINEKAIHHGFICHDNISAEKVSMFSAYKLIT